MIKFILILTLIFSQTTFAPPGVLATLPLNGGCEECVGNTCVQAPCNIDCKHYGTWCESIVRGGAQQEYTPETRVANGDYAEFYIQRVVKNNQAMESVGIKIGDTVTHVNNVFPESTRKFAELVIRLPKGTRLRILRQNGEREEIVL